MNRNLNVAFLPSSSAYLNNVIFIEKFRDNCNEPHRLLKAKLAEVGINLNTVDIAATSIIDVLICTRHDYQIGNIRRIVKAHDCACIYWVTEEETVCPLHEKRFLNDPMYDVVLTWRSDFIDNKNFMRCFYPSPIKVLDKIDFVIENKKRRLNIINSFKKSRSKKKLDLYNYRIEVAQSLAEKDACDIYGAGWPSTTTNYMGRIESKKNIQSKYLFTLCIENTLGEPGAITEKIFDAFEAGSIPLYLGASDIADYVPENSFISLNERRSADEIISIIDECSNETASDYLESIWDFIGSPAYETFNSVGFVESVQNAIIAVPDDSISGRVRVRRSKIFWLKQVFQDPLFFIMRPKILARLFI